MHIVNRHQQLTAAGELNISHLNETKSMKLKCRNKHKRGVSVEKKMFLSYAVSTFCSRLSS